MAGFGSGDIDITARQNMLVVTGRKTENRNKDGNFLHMSESPPAPSSGVSSWPTSSGSSGPT